MLLHSFPLHARVNVRRCPRLTSSSVDPPFFQDPSAGSNEGGPADPIPHELLPTHKAAERSETPQDSKTSSTQDYRSVIDDLTVEIKRLKDELKRYRHVGPDTLRRQKLFEIKFHGLPQWKKQELESTLRDFAAGLNGESSTEASSSVRKKSSRNTPRLQAGSSLASKHPSSSSDSHRRPVDSAYHSMSVGNRSGHSELPQSKRSCSKDTDRKVEDYLKDIPEGLYPRHITMSDKQKKKLVVRRLEQLFTGKSGRKSREKQEAQEEAAPAAAADDGPSREARILPTTNPKGKVAAPGVTGSATQSNTNVTSQSNTDLTSSWSGNKSGGNDNASGAGSGRGSGTASGSGGSNPSPSSNHPFEQRPTRPRDLDPDRMPDPSENMEYLRHLGVTPAPDPAVATRSGTSPSGVSADAEGWVYLNLLSNLAQLHIFNVAPSFVRAAVAEKSSKFQLSSDGRKIRWRGGNSEQGTRFSSESEGMGSRASTDDGESPDGSRKRVRISDSGEDGSADTLSSERNESGSGLESFHYKPLFARGESPGEQASQVGSGSSPESGGDSYNNGSGWDNSHSASSRRRKRRLDGAIIYYSGAPFCTDLSGDPGYQSPTTYMASSGEGAEQQSSEGEAAGGSGRGTISGSSLAYRPLAAAKGKKSESASAMDTSSDAAVSDLAVIEDSDGEDIKAEFPWSQSKQKTSVLPLEPCGLGGVLPEDNFVMTVTTKRPKDDARADRSTSEALAEAKGKSALEKLASKAPYSAAQKHPRPSPPLDIEYVSGRIKRLRPATLPPPAVFLPPFSSDESSGWDDDDAESESESEGLSSRNEGSSSRRVNPHHSDHSLRVSDGDETSGSVEDDEASVAHQGSVEDEGSRKMAKSGRSGRLSGSGRGGRAARRGSLAATAGGASSGYNSSMEEGE